MSMKEKTLIILNKTFQHGFGVAPWIIMRNPKIPHYLKPLYINLLSYAWYEAECFPGQERLAEELGVNTRTTKRHLRELKDIGLLDWKRRGLNKTNVYYLLDIPHDLMPVNFEAEVTPVSPLEVTPVSHPTIEIDEELTTTYERSDKKDRKKPQPLAKKTNLEVYKQTKEENQVKKNTGMWNKKAYPEPKKRKTSEDYRADGRGIF